MPDGKPAPQGALGASETRSGARLLARLLAARDQTESLVEPLSDADATVQSMPDASPAKWHLAHTTWFFEAFLLEPHMPGYRCFDPQYAYLFNSYYESLGKRHARPRRGMLTRPSLAEVLAYRRHVNSALAALGGEQVERHHDILELGLNHEQQHQELLLTDILNLFAQNPLEPAYLEAKSEKTALASVPHLTWQDVPARDGVTHIGAPRTGFAFDCERPRHKALVNPAAIASRPVTNGEFMQFMKDGGYERPEFWLSDGWAIVQAEGWTAPLYWREDDGVWTQMTLFGRQPVDLEKPVCHVSYFEADAYASWAGCRLPTEVEWEASFAASEPAGPLLDGAFGGLKHTESPFGNVWEWTASPYTPYPGFKPLEGAPGEYNGKFMNGQYVLKGGSCATPADHIRASYRNFFFPHQRWQFMGFRLARDLASFSQ